MQFFYMSKSPPPKLMRFLIGYIDKGSPTHESFNVVSKSMVKLEYAQLEYTVPVNLKKCVPIST